MKKLANMLFTLGVLSIFVGLGLHYRENILTLVDQYFSPYKEVELGEVNDYYRDYDFLYVQNTSNFIAQTPQDILNVYYTVINAGKDQFTVYCDKEYTDCLDEVQRLANDQNTLSDINNYAHPYNGFSHIETEYDTLGRVSISITKNYTQSDILAINQKIDELYPTIVSDSNTLVDNIRNIHDYIIDHTRYDSNRSDNKVFEYKSDIAYGPLFEGYAICGGYTDLMQLFLEKMNLKSFRVSSNEHIWNAVEIDNKWYHIDLTWDDPVAEDGKDYLSHEFLLVDTDRLLSSNHQQHLFDEDVFKEVKRN